VRRGEREKLWRKHKREKTAGLAKRKVLKAGTAIEPVTFWIVRTRVTRCTGPAPEGMREGSRNRTED
jgi:hypothetical protein